MNIDRRHFYTIGLPWLNEKKRRHHFEWVSGDEQNGEITMPPQAHNHISSSHRPVHLFLVSPSTIKSSPRNSAHFWLWQRVQMIEIYMQYIDSYVSMTGRAPNRIALCTHNWMGQQTSWLLQTEKERIFSLFFSYRFVLLSFFLLVASYLFSVGIHPSQGGLSERKKATEKVNRS